MLDWLLTQLSLARAGALDAGCGSGRHTLALTDRFDEVVGVDRSQPLIDLARRTRPHSRIRYQAGDLLAIRDPEGFDLVFSSTTLHHLPDLEAALVHLRRLVAPGGLAILVDNVAPRPTPPRWVYRLGAIRDLPADRRRHSFQQAWWLLKFRTSAPGWTTSPATATCPARRSNSATAPPSPAPLQRPRPHPRSQLAQLDVAIDR